MHGWKDLTGLFFALCLVLSGCAPAPGVSVQSSPTPAATLTPALSYDQLIVELRARGFRVESEAAIGSSGEPKSFDAGGWYTRVNTNSLSVYEFADVESAIAAKAYVAENGLTVRTATGAMIHGDPIATMHVFQSGRLIIFYAGCDNNVLRALIELAGPQFAGEVPGRDPNTLNHQCKY